LPKVSDEALLALQEEFTELDGVIDRLRQVKRTPVDAEELSEFEAAVELAREVGLLEIYEGTEDEVRRYKVPDIYRYAIGLTRKGQA
jgi:hypothetical protein